MKLNLGCGSDIRQGWTNVDAAGLPGVDIQLDVTRLNGLADCFALDLGRVEAILANDPAGRRMFRVVGAHYSPAFVAQDDWFLKHTWTREQEDKFRDWLIDELRKIGVSRKRAAWEACMFLMDRGWRRRVSE